MSTAATNTIVSSNSLSVDVARSIQKLVDPQVFLVLSTQGDRMHVRVHADVSLERMRYVLVPK
jgi:hypothetical protein